MMLFDLYTFVEVKGMINSFRDCYKKDNCDDFVKFVHGEYPGSDVQTISDNVNIFIQDYLDESKYASLGLDISEYVAVKTYIFMNTKNS